MKKVFVMSVCAGMLLAFSGFVFAASDVKGDISKPPKVVAQVGGTKILLSEMQEVVDTAPDHVKQALLAQKDKLLDEMVNQELFYQEGMALKLAEDAVVLQSLERARKQIIIQRMLQMQVQDKVKVTSAEVKEYYEKNPDKFLVPERVRAAHILVKDEKLANALLDKIKKGTDFASLAAEHSVDPSKMNGGDLGFFARGSLVPEFEKAVFALPEGGVSGVVQTKYGFHIIKSIKKEAPKPLDFGEVKENLAAQMLATKQQEELSKILQALTKKNSVQTHPELLGEIK